MVSVDVLERIAGAGLFAPSADNSQPWLLKRKRNRISLSVDNTRTGLFFDADSAATFMSCGAVVENMMLEASLCKLDSDLILESPGDVKSFRAILELEAGHCEADALAQAISSRATHRGLFSKRRPASEIAKWSIQAALAPLEGTHVCWCDTDQERRLLMRAAFGADLIRYTHPEIHRDFHAKLRFGCKADEMSDGLADDTLGIESFLLPFLRLLSPWPLARFLNLFGLHYLMAWRGCWLPMQTAPGLGVLTCGPSVDYFQAGRALERIWLAATAANLDFQPMGALPLLLIRLDRLEGAGLSAAHISKLRKLDDMWRSAAGLIDSPQRLVMIFRIGKAAKPPVRARRRDLASFLTTSTDE